MSEAKINEKEFTAAISALNAHLKENEKEEIKIVDVPLETQVESFLATVVGAIEDRTAQDLPPAVIEYYNNNIVEDDEEEEEETTEEKPKSEKKKKPKKEKKPKKTVEKDSYGVTMTSGAHKINMMLEEGATMNDMIEKVGTTRSRVQSHMASLKKKGWFIDNVDGVFTITAEEPPERPKPEKKKKAKKEKPAKTKEADTTEEKSEEKPKKASSKKKTTTKKSSSKKTSTKKGK
jgi:hypothetical protein